MAEPFIWQFQYKIVDIPFWLNWQSQNQGFLSDSYHYEQRFFWPESSKIILQGFDKTFLQLSMYDIEFKTDNYLLLPDNRNIKFRKKKLHYKPFIHIDNNAFIYEAKQKYHLLKQQQEILTLLESKEPIELKSKSEMKQWLCQNHQVCEVSKESLKLDLPTTHSSIELSRIQVGFNYYHSIVIESLSSKWVSEAVKAMGIDNPPQDYVSFLKGIA